MQRVATIGRLSGIKAQRTLNAIRAITATATKPAASPKFPTIIPESVVLSEAPILETAPTKPWARLNRPVRPVESAIVNGCNTPSIARHFRPPKGGVEYDSADAIQDLDGNQDHWFRNQRKQQGTDRQNHESDEQQRAAPRALNLPARAMAPSRRREPGAQ